MDRFVYMMAMIFFLQIPHANAGILDQLDDLKGKVVIHAGEIKPVECPIYGEYDCLAWPRNLLKVRRENFCFTASITACERFGCKGIIAVGEDKVPYFFELESIGNGVEKHHIKLIKCPSLY